MKIDYLYLFLILGLFSWPMVAKQHLPVPSGSNKHDNILIASSDGAIHLVESDSWKVLWSFSSGSALCSSHQQVGWGKEDDTKSHTNGDYSIVCGDDWNLYVRKRKFDEVEPIGTMGKYVNSAPHYLKGITVFGHKEVINFSVDAKTGRVNSAGTVVNGPALIKKDMGESTNMPANELHITRTNYELRSYFRDTSELAWNLTVSYIKFMYRCFNFGKTYNDDGMPFPCGAKGVVYRSRGHNPLHFELKSLDMRDEDEVIFLPLPPPSISIKLNMSFNRLGPGTNDHIVVVSIVLSIFCFIVAVCPSSWQKELVQPNRQPKQRKGKNENNGSTSQGRHILLEIRDDFIEKLLLESDVMGLPGDLLKDLKEVNGRLIGSVFVSRREIGKGTNGTIFFEGIYKRRVRVAIRMVKMIKLNGKDLNWAAYDCRYGGLNEVTRHPNIVHLFAVALDEDYYYFALERCICNLYELIQLCSNNMNGDNVQDEAIMQIVDKLWLPNGYPSPKLIKLIRDVVAGLAHLHKLGFVDRDLRPGNVLISSDNSLCAKICDQGTFSTRVKGCDKSPGQHTPELLPSEILMPAYEIPVWEPLEFQLHAADLFNLGCLIFFVLTKGSNLSDRSLIEGANVAKSYRNFTLVENVYEAAHLISNLLHPNPRMRFAARRVLVHPFFWDSKTRGSFLLDVSDWLERKGRKRKRVVNAMMNAAPVVFGGSWDVKMEAWFITFATYHKNYSYDCVLDLLLLIRNTLRHEQSFPKDIQIAYGYDLLLIIICPLSSCR
eukprot:TRINITY_DN17628_c0_g1_i9.p1 TRINITY_DN17628_c0_g1~~TRINITY_DN17628_c0_g1_i9.p1  ORF type:complete len:774 (+),score=87.89 TRINITY_DN17628_c0_g1_i9:127-2448(+)